MYSGETVNILLVDDEPDHLRGVLALLAPLHEHVLCATSVDEVLQQVAAHDFAVILINTPLQQAKGIDLEALAAR